MSDFKIIGNPDPVVGKEEFYSVNTFLPSVLPFQNSASSNSFEQPVKWEIYILENGRWRKTKENDKTGKRISYTFLQKSLERKGIRILARRGEDVARLNVTTHPAEKPKIESIELLDKNGQKPGKPLSYGQTLKARVHCLHMEKHKVSVTLWEDDAIGAGHNKANENNLIQTLSGVVANGKANVDFLLRPSFAKIAKQNGPEEGKIHEYYVTVDFNKDKIASNNVNVNDLEAPVAPFKGKVPVQQQAPAKPKASLPQPTQSKTKAPATGSSSAPKVKAEITRVHITNSAKQPIKGTHKEKEIIVWVDSQGLIGKEIRFKLYDEDYLSNDLLVDQKIKITGDIFPITVHLDRILRSKGGISGEGAEQELFADVEVIQTSIHSKSEVVDVDAKVFKPDPVEQTNKVAKVGESSSDDKNKTKTKCFCNKDFEEKDVKKLVKILKGKETIWEGADLKGNKHIDCNISDKTFATLTKALNTAFKKYSINTCIQKIHFLAQVCEETGTFALSEETKSDFISSQSIYKGRGLLQLTGVRVDPSDKKSRFDKPGPYQDYADYKGNQKIVKDPSIVANDVDYCIDSGAWIWSINKKMPSDVNSDAVKRWSRETAGKSLNELAVFADKYLELISVLLNGRNGKTNMPNNWEKRKRNYYLLKNAFFLYNKYHADGSKPVNPLDLVTYHIYAEGKIEKVIPKVIKKGYENKYNYVYHDKNNEEHSICVLDWYNTKGKEVGIKHTSKPTHSEVLTDEIVSDGNTTRRVKYKNDDIAEYGTHPTKGLMWRLYKSTGRDIELIKMPDSLDYYSDDLVIKYSFSSTKRRYTGPNVFAGFIGALAECNNLDGIVTTGSCFKEGSCFPSAEHVNGRSVDTLYYKNLKKDQAFIDAVVKFKFTEVLVGDDTYFKKLKNAGDGGALHNSHLHSGNFNDNSVKVIKK
ncbi:hypothetical protein PQ462_09525 [Flavobacterium sp. KACC 22758]|uniref:hypothetical protein n=1 Tax=Flavobacterium sp. KACC 22758 TaxID=3025667 RepID=UPI002366C9AD|nr:hypothetical protein [Flavobacterium sp. KACC 22758]WDF61610.1 hypothetical protein PQ462_09525 [Flavobacterium sp. KACC 22758]